MWRSREEEKMIERMIEGMMWRSRKEEKMIERMIEGMMWRSREKDELENQRTREEERVIERIRIEGKIVLGVRDQEDKKRHQDLTFS